MVQDLKYQGETAEHCGKKQTQQKSWEQSWCPVAYTG